MAKKQRHAYTEEFRREAVRRSDQPGSTAASVAKELGLHPGQIYNWRRQFSRLSDKQFNSLSGVDYSKQESEEVRRLKRELHEARKENEFLKKLLSTSRSSRSEDGRWLYLATVMDLYSRAIVGWKLDTSMTEKLAMDALSMAFANRDVQPGLIIHSDRGVQFRSVKYLDMIRSRGCLPSMSRQGNCWDNAVMESFYSRLKVELIYAEQYASIEAVRSGIFEYIEIFYNRKRRHSALGNISPAEFERRCA